MTIAKANVSLATSAKAALTQKADKSASTAKIKDFGTATVITVSDELSSKMVWASKRYKSIVSTRAKQLVDLKEIGAVILDYRNACPSDKEFGKQIKATPLKAISQQDRNDLMWLASNWEKIEDLKNKGTLSSNSVGVLRKQLRELENPVQSTKKQKSVSAKGKTSGAKPESLTQQAKQAELAETAAKAAAGTVTSPKEMNAETLAKMVVDQLNKNGISVADFENAFEAALKG